MTRAHDHDVQESQKTKELHLSEKLVSAQATAGHAMKTVAAQAVHTLPVVQARNAMKTAVVHALPVQDAVSLVQEAADQTMRTVHHAALPAVEALSNPESREKIGHVALHVADHIIDEGSRPLTGGLPVYKYTKKAVIVANETISEHRKNKATEHTMVQETPDQTMVHEAPDHTMVQEVVDHTMRVVRHAATSTAEAMSTPDGREKIGRDALHIADHIIDEGSRPYTGGIPVYKYTKDAIIVANETISENRKNKATDHTTVQKITDQTIRVVRHAATSAAETMSTPEGREKFGREALHVADHIIDEGSRPYTGGVPAYKYTKKAIIVANDKIYDHRKKKAVEKTEVQEATDQAVLHDATLAAEATSISEGLQKIERDAFHIAYHIIDEAIRPDTGSISDYQEEIIVVNEVTSKNQDKKEVDQTMVQEVDDQTMRVVCHTVTSTAEVMSTTQGQKKIGHDALHAADHIIDEASRPYTGGLPVYRCTKEAVIVASEKISENRKKKEVDQTIMKEPVEYQTMVQEPAANTRTTVHHDAAPVAKNMSTSVGRNWTCCAACFR